MIAFPVKPDATPEEVRAVVDDDQGGPIFSQAVRVISIVCQVPLNPLSAHELKPIRRVSRRLP
jgi:hypothetical protein